MERVAFLVEPGGRRIGCLLNPEDVTLRRSTGVVRRRSAGGAIAGAGLSDDPLLFTGGGTTELELELLFDVELAGSTDASVDVRDLTRPLWQLSENAAEDGSFGRPPTVRFVWGKHWNVPGVVTSVAERFERIAPDGVPGRSWLRLRLVRVPEPPPRPVAPTLDLGAPALPDVLEPAQGVGLANELVHEIAGGVDEPYPGPGEEGGGPPEERLDQLAWRYLGDPSLWPLLAALNDVADPLRLARGLRLRVPAAGEASAP